MNRFANGRPKRKDIFSFSPDHRYRYSLVLTGRRNRLLGCLFILIGDVNVNMANVVVVRLLAALFYGVSSFMITVSNKVVLTSYK